MLYRDVWSILLAEFLFLNVQLRIAQGEDEDGQGPQTKLPGDQVKTDAVKQPPVKDGVVRRALTIRRKDGSNAEPKKLSPLEVRAKIVEEILNSERDYVNHLRDIVEVKSGQEGREEEIASML